MEKVSKLAKKILYSGMLATFLLIQDTNYNKMHNLNIKKCIDYIANIEQIKKDHKEKLGIIHVSNPNIRIENLSSLVKIDQNMFAYYSSKDSTVHLYRELIKKDFELTKRSLDHELGHHYMHTVLLKDPKVKTSYFQLANSNDDLSKLRIKIVSEGIAEYFARTINGNKYSIRLNPKKWPKSVDSFIDRVKKDRVYYYCAGPRIISPIAEEFGPAGLEFIVRNIPTGDELVNPNLYLERARAFMYKCPDKHSQ